ncbi:MAG: tryptophan 7-halogenase [Acidimicrobiales bacterium]
MSGTGTLCRYDVVVLGGGPAGSATVLALARMNPKLSVALVESSDYTSPRIGETLPPTALPVLDELGAGHVLDGSVAVAAYGSCAVWGSNEIHDNEFIFHPQGRGWHLDRRRFDARLAWEAAQRGSAVHLGTRLVAAERTGGHWRLWLQSRRGGRMPVDCRFVVDASGRRAILAARQGVERVRYDDLVAATAFVDFRPGEAPADTTTLVEACEHGWWYSARVPGSRMVAAFFSDADIVRGLGARSTPGWLSLLEAARHTHARLRTAARVTRPSIAAAHSQRLEAVSGDSWVAVGDAAGTFDPLSSQGIGKALRSALQASSAIGETRDASAERLERYSCQAAQQYEDYLDVRAAYYVAEQRWPRSPFWQRRHEHITLHPSRVLSPGSGGVARGRRARLPVRDLEQLVAICRTPRTASDVIARFHAVRGPHIGHRRVLLALQDLISDGLIAAQPDRRDESCL